jgi:hypothetical protein
MKAWSNIQISPKDPEIVKINKFEKKLGKLPNKVHQVRELITRFEVCHFKYQEHLSIIKDSIINLESTISPNKIGMNHVRRGENVWQNDKTGRSLTGQQYIWAIRKWLDEKTQGRISSYYHKELGRRVEKWLGDKNPEEERIVRLLLSRLTWDWKSYGKLQRGGDYKELEFQVCRMDICHYAFPKNLDLLLEGIGKMKAVEEFEGCGSFNKNIKTFIKKEFFALSKMIESFKNASKPDKKKLIQSWLILCLAKTIKEQVNLAKSLLV